MGERRTRRRGKAGGKKGGKKGGTKSILRRQRSSSGEKEKEKTRKTVSWHPDARSPKKLGRTRAQTRKQK